MPAPRRARTRLACGLAATAVAAGLAAAPLAAVTGPLRPAMAWLAALGLLVAAAAALRLGFLLGPALIVLVAEHAIAAVGGGNRIDATAPLVGAGLLLYAELMLHFVLPAIDLARRCLAAAGRLTGSVTGLLLRRPQRGSALSTPAADGGECAELEQEANAVVDSARRGRCRSGGAAVGHGQDRAVQRCPSAGSWR